MSSNSVIAPAPPHNHNENQILQSPTDTLLASPSASIIHTPTAATSAAAAAASASALNDSLSHAENTATPSSSLMVLFNNDHTDNVSFEETVKLRARARREKEDLALASLRAQTKRLEAALAGESKRRVDALIGVQKKATEEIIDMKVKLQQQVTTQQEETSERMQLLEERLALLETKWQTDISTLTTCLERTSTNLQDQLTQLKEQYDQERSSRVSQDEQFAAEIQRIADEYRQRWTTERQERLQSVCSLQDAMMAREQAQGDEQRTLQSQVRMELDLLTTQVAQEATDRRAADEEIIAGLNRYIQQVQKSLAYVSGV
jgi:hypothetical protein